MTGRKIFPGFEEENESKVIWS